MNADYGKLILAIKDEAWFVQKWTKSDENLS